eukprot:13748-Heterococcus_DN1.PRE.3
MRAACFLLLAYSSASEALRHSNSWLLRGGGLTLAAQHAHAAAAAAAAAALEESAAGVSDVEPYPHYAGMRAVEAGEAPAPKAGIVLVDAFCKYLGLYVAKEVNRRGFACVQVLSDHLLSIMEDDSVASFAVPEQARCISESDAGLQTAERLQSDLCSSSGGINRARRDKFLMNEALKAAVPVALLRLLTTVTIVECITAVPSRTNNKHEYNTYNVLITSVLVLTLWLTVTTLLLVALATVQQAKAANLSDISKFVQTLSAATATDTTADNSSEWPLIVIKPLRGCASGDVYLCDSADEAKTALDTIIGTPLYATPGAVNEEVLVQEFLVGQEYVVDTVSCNGVHKVMAVWKYDKRPTNGAAFVYYRTQLRHCSSSSSSSRTDSSSSAKGSGGATAGATPEAAVVAYARSCAFVPVSLKMHTIQQLGCALCWTPVWTRKLASCNAALSTRYVTQRYGRWHLTDFGPLCNDCIGYNAVDATIDAYLDHDAIDLYDKFEVGQSVTPTIDIRSDAGWVRLCHTDAAVVEQDYQFIVNAMPTMFEVAAVQ